MDSSRGMKPMAVLVVLSMLLTPVMLISPDSSAAEGNYALVDWGNGVTEWMPCMTTGTVQDAISGAFPELNIEFGTEVRVDGLGTKVTGSASGTGSYSEPGTTGNQVTVGWRFYQWESGVWAEASYGDECTGSVAMGYYPAGVSPVETPEYMRSWVMMAGDSAQTNHAETVTDTKEPGDIKWTQDGYTYASMLNVEDSIIAKYGTISKKIDGILYSDARVVSIDRFTGETEWEFRYPGMRDFETATPCIVGDSIYVPSATGYVFKFNWKTGPGTLDMSTGRYSNPVTVTDSTGSPREFVYNDMKGGVGSIPDSTAELVGMPYNAGNTSIICDSGTLLFSNSNGMTYCTDLNLNLIWSYQNGGSIYYTTPSVHGDYVFVGALNGELSVIDRTSGALIDSETVYQIIHHEKKYGCVNTAAIIEDGEDLMLLFTISGGRGMNTVTGGYAVYRFDGTHLSKVVVNSEFGLSSNYMVPYVSDSYKGVFFHGPEGLYKLDISGHYEMICGGLKRLKASPLLVNEELLYLQSYAPANPTYIVSIDGKIQSTYVTSINNYSMCAPLVIGNWTYIANDSGIAAVNGLFKEYVYDVPEEEPWWHGAVMFSAAVIILLLGVYIVLRFGLKKDEPWKFVKESFRRFVMSDEVSHNTRSRHRLLVMVCIGIILTISITIASLCIGPTLTMGPGEMFSALFSAIEKGGQNLTYEELMVFSSRLPRTLVALAVGIGLSVAGVMYQAIIRNPLVDPYIMGVSAGAGTAAVAVLGLDFTFFGLLSGSIYLTAASAMVGGVVAFFITMLIAEKAGGTSINYVLAGVVVGMVFSAMQSLILIMGSENLSNSITWLFGSFSNISWDQVAIVFFPVLAMSLAPLIWAKEFNLVLLGEDQAKQMGLNVVRFNRLMLILASLLASLCVAFVGIIGFVGLVVPHLCRMVLGGDHRLVLPSSIAFGGFLMVAADLAARTIWYGMELPVGAITTIIGVPVFAWLLIRKGRMYDG